MLNPSPIGRECRVGHAPGMALTARGAVTPTLGPLGEAEWEGEGSALASILTLPPLRGSFPLPKGEDQ